MATGTFTLRPSADVSLNHSVYPTTLTAGYQAIGEEVSDGNSTYLTGTSSAVSTFVFSGTLPTKIKSIQSGSISLMLVNNLFQYGRLSNKNNSITLYINGSEVGSYIDKQSSPTEMHSVFAIENSQINLLNEYITSNGVLPEIQLSVSFYANYESNDSAKGGGNADLTQMYVELIYEETSGLNIHHKINGTWLQAQAAYQKQNGTWVEITEDTCKEILQNNLLSSGNV